MAKPKVKRGHKKQHLPSPRPLLIKKLIKEKCPSSKDSFVQDQKLQMIVVFSFLPIYFHVAQNVSWICNHSRVEASVFSHLLLPCCLGIFQITLDGQQLRHYYKHGNEVNKVYFPRFQARCLSNQINFQTSLYCQINRIWKEHTISLKKITLVKRFLLLAHIQVLTNLM